MVRMAPMHPFNSVHPPHSTWLYSIQSQRTQYDHPFLHFHTFLTISSTRSICFATCMMPVLKLPSCTLIWSNGCHLPLLWCKTLVCRTCQWVTHLSNLLALLSLWQGCPRPFTNTTTPYPFPS